MARQFYSEEVAGGSMPLDLTVDPGNVGNAQYPADWVEMTGGGTLTYLDGSGESQTITSSALGYVVKVLRGFTKLVSLSGASPNLVRVGTGDGPKALGAAPGLTAIDATLVAGTVTVASGHDLSAAVIVGYVLKALNSTPALGAQVLVAFSTNSLVVTSKTVGGATATTDVATYTVFLQGVK